MSSIHNHEAMEMKYLPHRQKGSVLITLIIVMTITAALGAGMVYFTSSSTLSELFSNQEARAYYIAEGGGRYAFLLLKNNSSHFDSYTQASPYNQTFTLSNGEQFVLVVYQDPASANKVVIQSTGIVNSGLWTQARRSITWNIDKTSLASSSPKPVNLSSLPAKDAAGKFSIVNIGGEEALRIDKVQGGGNSQEFYIGLTSGTSASFYNAWMAAGGFLSYDSQVKAAIGIWNEASNDFSFKPPRYSMGLATQYRRSNSANQDRFLSVSIVRTRTSPQDGISNTLIPAGMADNIPMVVLWHRDGNQGGGGDYWLAYQTITTNDYILQNHSCGIMGLLCLWVFGESTWDALKPWSTIYVRLVEAASIKLETTAGAPEVTEGSYITGNGGGSAKIIKKIKDSDNKIVLLLNNITGTFVLPASVSGYSTSASWGYRAKDNYLWAFYGDTAAHGTSNSNPLDNNRLANPRMGTEGALSWVVSGMADWTAEKDNFRLVQWNNNLNSSATGDASIRLMGGTTGNEANAIIRTNLLVTGGIGSYTSNTFPPETAVICLGDSCNSDIDIGSWSGYSRGYFSDYSYLLNSGGSGIPSGVQY